MENSRTIRIESLWKKYRVKTSVSLFRPVYKEIEAIRGISLCHNLDHNLGIFGKNGAGKTTLVKLLTGILHSSSGEILVLGHIPYKLKPEFKKQIGLFQGGKEQLIWDLPAIQSLELSRYIYGFSRDEFKKRITHFSQALDIGDELDQPLRNMSLGQRCKMELIYSFIHLPKIVFLDEPTSGLDIITRSKLRSFINFCHKEYGICFIITSHNVKDITDCCNSCIVLDNGEIIYQGDTTFLLEKHQHEVITLSAKSNDVAREIAEKFGGTTVEDEEVVFESTGNHSKQLICQILAQYEISDFSIKKKDDEEIITEILKNE
ncbi:MAG: ATP-binding cassette domain-containing protein [Candidatus Cloacimonas sp.]|jgi:ABC-2 type transport system ATP-binding protein|nr:ATP-binding cassette domain-containing protein [Candidatus Cloacimonas sp.]MCK9164642.1 ATP-binding cassette domain-containing protein [Candidatus Cloacimonas sp.]HOU25835.1 ATP-binding cassette domain-containing protein [Candidatus Cloacimonas sp.]HPN26950.1 ATP-binding cassette domain-containing protein [Candidatus Cloacimonas sp.]